MIWACSRPRRRSEFGGELLAGIEEPLATVDEEPLLSDDADLMMELTAETSLRASVEEEIDLDLVDAETTAEAATAEITTETTAAEELPPVPEPVVGESVSELQDAILESVGAKPSGLPGRRTPQRSER